MASISGKDGACAVANIGTINFRSWTATGIGPQTVDCPAFGDAFTYRAAGIENASFTAEGWLDGSTAPATTTVLSAVTLTAASGRTFTGSAICRISPSVAVDSEAAVTVEGDFGTAVTPA